MKTNKTHIPNQHADFVVERDVFGQIKNMRSSITKKLNYKSINAPDLQVTYAGLWPRTIATLIDLAIVLIAELILNMILFPSNLITNELIAFKIFSGLFIWVIYNGFFESIAFQATIGEMIVKIKVIDLYGKQMSFLRAIFRSVATILSILPFGFGIWYITTDPKKQSWHDLIAGSFVIKSNRTTLLPS